MHCSQHAAQARQLHRSEASADYLSFPPTQRTCLLCSPPPSSARSSDQIQNLLHSSDELLEALNTLVERLHPRYLLHGHVHPEYGRIERTREHPAGTTLINTCGWQMLDIDEATLPDRSRSTFWRIVRI